MARIRSVHPNQWVDDDFIECTPLARLLAIALRNFCDDNGAFEWKPKMLKRLCLPTDNCDMDALLAELVGSRQVFGYEIAGGKFGLVRNFTRFQSPKKPSFAFPVPASVPNGYALHPTYKRPSSPPVENQGTPLECPSSVPEPGDGGTGAPEGEERRGKERSGEENPTEAVAPEPPRPAAKSYVFSGVTIRVMQDQFDQWRKSFSAIPDLAAELQVLDDKLTSGELKVSGKGWFPSVSNWLRTKHERLLAQGGGRPAEPVDYRPIDDDRHVKAYREMDVWIGAWGPRPDEPGCFVAPEILRRHGYEPVPSRAAG